MKKVSHNLLQDLPTISHDLPTRCIDPVLKSCQDCIWGYCHYGDDVECYADLAGCSFESGCTLGFDQGRPEDEPTEEELQEFEKEFESYWKEILQ